MPRMETTTILRLEGDARLPVEAGNKALGLQRLIRAGLAVPDAWVILPSATAGQIKDFSNELVARGIGPFAVRISGVDADYLGHWSARVPETLLGVPPTLLGRAVRQVSRSTWPVGARALGRVPFPAPQGPRAVIVQRLVHARAAGVAFGRWHGAREIVIEATAGLGESGVRGTGVPEVVEVFPVDDVWEVRYRRPYRPPGVHFVPCGQVPRTSHARPGAGPLLSPASAREIAEWAAALQWDLGRPLVLGWAESGGRIWWLQMRPQDEGPKARPRRLVRLTGINNATM